MHIIRLSSINEEKLRCLYYSFVPLFLSMGNLPMQYHCLPFKQTKRQWLLKIGIPVLISISCSILSYFFYSKLQWISIFDLGEMK